VAGYDSAKEKQRRKAAKEKWRTEQGLPSKAPRKKGQKWEHRMTKLNNLGFVTTLLYPTAMRGLVVQCPDGQKGKTVVVLPANVIDVKPSEIKAAEVWTGDLNNYGK